jgi:hypothetical protein
VTSVVTDLTGGAATNSRNSKGIRCNCTPPGKSREWNLVPRLSQGKPSHLILSDACYSARGRSAARPRAFDHEKWGAHGITKAG